MFHLLYFISTCMTEVRTYNLITAHGFTEFRGYSVDRVQRIAGRGFVHVRGSPETSPATKTMYRQHGRCGARNEHGQKMIPSTKLAEYDSGKSWVRLPI